MSDIATKYDPNLNASAGFLVVGDHPNPARAIGDNGRTLLHCLFWLTYTEQGRGFLAGNKPPTKTPAEIASDLREVFTTKFGITNDVLHDALLQVHLAGTAWVEQNKIIANNASTVSQMSAATAARAVHEANYKQYMSVITWWLWEDAIGHEFSMSW